jgi:hypothetical protein
MLDISLKSNIVKWHGWTLKRHAVPDQIEHGAFKMAKVDLPSPEVLRQLLKYDADTGKLFWLKRSEVFFPSALACKRWNILRAGKEAFSYVGVYGYLRGSIFNQSLFAHRVAWAIWNGEWPNLVDHINGIKSDNRIVNLRNVTNSENNLNMKLFACNTSGFQGVCWFPQTKRWVARIHFENKSYSLGYFKNKEDAIHARREAEIKFGYHENHGRTA